MAAIALRTITKTYENGFEAVKGVSLDIPDGSFCVLVGPSGCGKSTTLRMVAGLESITGGTIEIGDRVVNNVHPKDRDIAMVFQNYALYPHMSVYDNMAFALKIRRLPRAEIERRVKAASDILGLNDLLTRKPAILSGGQRQRVAVGRAIVREPKAFLFDEPLSNLDAKLRVTTRAEIKSLQLRLKTTTIYVTHDQEEAMSLADMMVVMAGGLVQQIGRPMDLYRRPANRFVGGFVGTPPMNLLDGRLEAVAVGGGSGGNAGGGGIRFTSTLLDQTGAPCSVILSDAHARLLKGRAGQPATLGLRPQAISIAGRAAPSIAPWKLRIAVVEPMGDHTDVFLAPRTGPTIVARSTHAADLTPGDTLDAVIDPDAIHIFEPGEYGRNLTLA